MTHFFETWLEARNSFTSKIKNLDGIFESIPLSSKGPNGEQLSIGVGVITVGSDLSKSGNDLVLHVSGVHGVEGFAGSAAQLNILDELYEQKQSGKLAALPPRTIAFIHTVNPFGMSWFRRNNAHNVDLNRNAISSGKSYPRSDAYLDLHKILMDRSFFRHAWVLRLGGLLLMYGKSYVMQGLSGGQYQYADGFFFGGHSWQEELIQLSDFLRSKFGSVHKVFAIDIHTGLGPYGFEALFAHETADATDIAAFSKDLDVTLTLDQIEGESTYRASGGFAHMIYAAFPYANIRYILQEFGTFNGFRVLRGLRAEHHAWLSGRHGPEIKASKNLKRLFFPEDSTWRKKVLDHSSLLFQKVVLAGFR